MNSFGEDYLKQLEEEIKSLEDIAKSRGIAVEKRSYVKAQNRK